jgi:hypothetical protein
VEENPVRKVGECVVLGHVGIDFDLTPQPSPHREGDAEQEHVQRCQPNGKVPIETVETSVNIGADGSVGEIYLKHPHPMDGRSGDEREIDLHRIRARWAQVGTVTVERRHTGDGDTTSGFESLVVVARLLVEPRAIVGIDDVPIQVTETQS